MEADDDDFYGGEGARGGEPMSTAVEGGFKEEQMDVSEGQEEDEDSDDDVQFTLEKPEGTKMSSVPPSRNTRQQASQERAVQESKSAKTATPVKQEQRTGSTVPPATVKGTLTHDGKEGKDFPEIRTSKIEVNGTPIWPATDKLITDIDVDAELAENSKAWRLPGTDQTDFFNYGFDEYTWAQYCLRQQTMGNTISEQKQADAQMKAMFGASGNGQSSNGGAPPGMPPMPGMAGMPSPEEMMQQMMAQGMNPGDMGQFMQFMGGGMQGMQGGQGQQNQQQGGRMQNSASPHPQAGQGFQPPQGPAAHNQQQDQGGYPGGMDGYSPQQIAIMQQQQQGGMGGGGRGRGRRGRGFY